MIFLPLKAPTFYYKLRNSPFIISEFGILPWIRAFIYEHTFYKNGKIEEKGAMGASFNVDLKNFLLGNIT